MADEGEEEQPIVGQQARGRHIKKRALKNKALSVTFDEKDLRNYVTGFHKRKKKRRKEAQKKQEEAQRRKRIEDRKKRKLERELVIYGGAPPANGSASDGSDVPEEDEDGEPLASISGTTTYDNGDTKVTVMTSEISHEEEIYPNEKTGTTTVPKLIGAVREHNLPVKKKPFKRVTKHKSRPKPQSKREKRKRKNKSKRGC
ncbi:ribosomal RNA-processing protein 17 [Ziziphus jujuba]|uniref:Ribosomal RNA-processing protein 17 n=1 Tax=Ziziphus jujuba TaxID=326968 RepID=A0A6P4A031_ZIZJJ|nr:ribosomal RNA-processing protein 17 [Ziziphus jujuba]